jgi:hypothetical protein
MQVAMEEALGYINRGLYATAEVCGHVLVGSSKSLWTPVPLESVRRCSLACCRATSVWARVI